MATPSSPASARWSLDQLQRNLPQGITLRVVAGRMVVTGLPSVRGIPIGVVQHALDVGRALLGRARGGSLTIEPGQITVDERGRPRQLIPTAAVQQIACLESVEAWMEPVPEHLQRVTVSDGEVPMQAATRVRHGVYAVLRSGEQLKLVAGISELATAQALEREIEAHLGIVDRAVAGELAKP